MTAMTCKLNGLFSIGEDFDDEDILGTDWTGSSVSGQTSAAPASSSISLRAPSVTHKQPEKTCNQQTGEKLSGLCNGIASTNNLYNANAQTVHLGSQRISQQPISNQTNILSRSTSVRDDFDDWDVDLADLDDTDKQMGEQPRVSTLAPSAISNLKSLQPFTGGGIQTFPNSSLRQLHNPSKTLSSSNSSPSPRPTVFRGLTATSPPSGSFSRTLVVPQQNQKAWTTPRAPPQAHRLFESVSPASSPITSLPLNTPVLTNRLVQLVSASSKIPKKRPRSESHQPRTRRFPGPAGLLPQQPQGQNLDRIVVSVPQTPAHGVVARLPSQAPSSQGEDDEFVGGAWAVMKAEMGLDERNPSCFLHSYSVVMVLRKAALKQLARNKVPNMAVLLKNIVHTHADAKAVFKDPTGEIQGTVHRRLLEEKVEELKVGAVLLLKQVGVFSPSHRNHYLNVTPNNLLRIYSPDGVASSSVQLEPPIPELTFTETPEAPSVLQKPVSQMQLMFDDDEDEEHRTERAKDQSHAEETQSAVSSRAPKHRAGNSAPPAADWDADDDLDMLLEELPEDTF